MKRQLVLAKALWIIKFMIVLSLRARVDFYEANVVE